MPVSGLWLTPVQPNSEVAVLPSTIAPASRSRVTIGVSSSGRLPRIIRLPNSVGMSLVIARSLIVTGTPCSRPTRPPPISAASARRAAAIAGSAARCAKALTRGSRRSTRARIARTTSTGETCLARIIAASQAAGA
jgi:hypothetical protein